MRRVVRYNLYVPDCPAVVQEPEREDPERGREADAGAGGQDRHDPAGLGQEDWGASTR